MFRSYTNMTVWTQVPAVQIPITFYNYIIKLQPC